MLTATIEQKCSASIKHRAFQCCTYTTILNQCLITLQKKDLTGRLQQKSQLQDRSFCFSNSNKQHQNFNRLKHKHLDGGLKSHFFFSPKKQTHTPK